jgi:hypothetical protein
MMAGPRRHLEHQLGTILAFRYDRITNVEGSGGDERTLPPLFQERVGAIVVAERTVEVEIACRGGAIGRPRRLLLRGGIGARTDQRNADHRDHERPAHLLLQCRHLLSDPAPTVHKPAM